MFYHQLFEVSSVCKLTFFPLAFFFRLFGSLPSSVAYFLLKRKDLSSMIINIYVELSFICNCNLHQFTTYLCMLSSLLSCHCHSVVCHSVVFRLYAIVTVMVVCCYSSKEATFKTYVFLLFFAVCDVPVLCFNPSFLWETWWQMFNKKPNRCNSAFFVFPTSFHYQWHLHVLLKRLFPNKGLQIGSFQVFRYATLIWNQIVLDFVFYFRCSLDLVCVMVSFSIPAYIIVWKKVMASLRTVSLLQDPPKSARRSSSPTFFSSSYLMFTNKNIVESVLCNIQIL